MSLKIAIASGKGGTGKTSVAVNLFKSVVENWSEKVQLFDCDVEEPNDLIFFPEAILQNKENVFQRIPEINKDKCTFCRDCVNYCEFNAIVVIPSASFAEVNESLCHSCGACLHACKFDAMTEKDVKIGEISYHSTDFGGELVQGELEIGSPMQTIVIKDLKRKYNPETEIILLDAPPGTSCPVVETISDVDFVLLVTEPTPFGLNDLKLTIDVVNELKKDFAVIINKDGIGNGEMENYLNKEGIEIIGRIPFSKDFASDYATGSLLKEIPEERKVFYKNLVEKLKIDLKKCRK